MVVLEAAMMLNAFVFLTSIRYCLLLAARAHQHMDTNPSACRCVVNGSKQFLGTRWFLGGETQGGLDDEIYI